MAKQRREGKEQHIQNPEDTEHGGKSSLAGQECEEGVRTGCRADEEQRGAVTEGGGDG